jgi:AraC-like DNA-binding protein
MGDPKAIDASPIQNVLLAMRMQRREAGYQFQATSLPGHLLHFVESGRVRQECNGRRYELRPGCVMWYHEDELVTGTLLRPPWIFYSVNFIAPTLPPPEFESRLYLGQHRLRPLFARLVRVWQDDRAQPLARKLLVHSTLLAILAALAKPSQQPIQVDPRARLWWQVETELRKDLSRRTSLLSMCALAGCSPATLARSCFYAVGLPPVKRLKQVRLSLARGLVERSSLTMKAIAERVGYPRVHEFSRDYRKHFGRPPTADRAAHN